MTRQPVCVGESEALSAAVTLMGEGDFSQLLVLSDSGLKLLTSEHISRWLGTQIAEDIVSLSETSVAEILGLLEDDGLQCVSMNASVFDAQGVFEDSIRRGKPRVFALAVTANGLRSEKALGIVTPWDLVAFDATTTRRSESPSV